VNSFLSKHGWANAQPLADDASARKYFRVEKNGAHAILMDASKADRNEFKQFIAIDKWLRSINLSAPEILEVDEGEDLMLIEDFGDKSFRKAIIEGVNEFELYAMGADVLAFLTHKTCPLDLPDYYQSNVHIGRRRIIDWFVPAIRQQKNPDGLVERYLKIWEDIEYQLPHPQMGFVHVDYHADNLMFLPARQDFNRCGILDFQNAMHGPVLYDLANLLEDARREVPREIRETIWASLDELEQGWTRILATQFHCRVIGQFIKFAVKDGNPAYLQHILRLQKYIHEALQDPLLKPLKAFFDDLKLDFSRPYDLNIPGISRFIREDAF
jgi:aminoglycoside/choline kinase family phosphotransferase